MLDHAAAPVLEGLEGRRMLSSSTYTFNFGPDDASTDAGILRDTGDRFGDRGNGFTYGWNQENGQGGFNRNSPKSRDQLHDTGLQMQGSHNRDAAWELAVPNGRYRVKIVAGDASSYGGHTAIDLENKIVLAGSRSSGNPWLYRDVDVNITDGRLTIDNSRVARDNRINFVQVKRLDGSFGPGNTGGNTGGGNNSGGGSDDNSGGSNDSGGGSSGGNGSPVGVSVSGDVLRITGDRGRDNNIHLFDRGDRFKVEISGRNYGEFDEDRFYRVEITGGDRNDRVTVADNVDVRTRIEGLNGNDYLRGGNRQDTLNGGNGDDQLYGRGGDDRLDGGAGTDTGDGGAGNDTATNIERGPDAGGNNDGGNDSGNDNNDNNDTGGNNTGGSDNNDGGSDGDAGFSSNPNAAKPTARIDVSDAQINAGNAVWVHGLDSTLRAGDPTHARYEWDFGDPNAKYNKLVGFNASHVYDRPGTYTIRLRVINEDGGSHSTSTTVRVDSAARREYYVASWGNDNNDGSRNRPWKTGDKARRELERRDNVAVYFHRGQTFGFSDAFQIRGDNVLVGAWGSGNRPLVRLTQKHRVPVVFRQMTEAQHTTIQDLRIDSIYNRNDGEKTDMPMGVMPIGKWIVVRDMEFSGVNDAVNAEAQPSGVLLQDSFATHAGSIRSYFFWGQGEDLVVLGNKAENSTRESVLRVGRDGAERVLVHDNVFGNIATGGADRVKGTVAMQHGKYHYVHGNTLNGPSAVGPLANNIHNTLNYRLEYAVFDANRFNDDHIQVDAGAEHVVLKNNIFDVQGDNAIEIDGYDSTYRRGVRHLDIIHNTGVNDSTRGRFIRLLGEAHDVNIVGNLYVAPNLFSGAYGAVNLNLNDWDLSSIGTIRNNVWARVADHYWSDNGQAFLGNNSGNPDAYLDVNEWSALSKTRDDTFANESLDSKFRPQRGIAEDAARVFDGVFADFYGDYRTGSGDRTAGAVIA